MTYSAMASSAPWMARGRGFMASTEIQKKFSVGPPSFTVAETTLS